MDSNVQARHCELASHCFGPTIGGEALHDGGFFHRDPGKPLM